MRQHVLISQRFTDNVAGYCFAMEKEAEGAKRNGDSYRMERLRNHIFRLSWQAEAPTQGDLTNERIATG